nr:unnamed protein product [Digitaria exilis]
MDPSTGVSSTSFSNEWQVVAEACGNGYRPELQVTQTSVTVWTTTSISRSSAQDRRTYSLTSSGTRGFQGARPTGLDCRADDACLDWSTSNAVRPLEHVDHMARTSPGIGRGRSHDPRGRKDLTGGRGCMGGRRDPRRRASKYRLKPRTITRTHHSIRPPAIRIPALAELLERLGVWCSPISAISLSGTTAGHVGRFDPRGAVPGRFGRATPSRRGAGAAVAASRECMCRASDAKNGAGTGARAETPTKQLSLGAGGACPSRSLARSLPTLEREEERETRARFCSSLSSPITPTSGPRKRRAGEKGSSSSSSRRYAAAAGADVGGGGEDGAGGGRARRALLLHATPRAQDLAVPSSPRSASIRSD